MEKLGAKIKKAITIIMLMNVIPMNKNSELTWDWYSKIENSLIKDLFVGHLKSSLQCERVVSIIS